MKLLIVLLIACSATCYGRNSDTYTVDAGGCVTVDRDMRQDDLSLKMIRTDPMVQFDGHNKSTSFVSGIWKF